jgi:GDSL-like Lipase/Acylhydrolase family
LILLGDSLAEYWDTRAFSPFNVVNLGVAGDKTQNEIWHLNTDEWSKFKPRGVLIMLGTNNLPDDKPCAIVAGLKKVIERVKSIWPLAHVFPLEIPPRGEDFLKHNKSRVQINEQMRRVPRIKSVNADDELTVGGRTKASGPCPNILITCTSLRLDTR